VVIHPNRWGNLVIFHEINVGPSLRMCRWQSSPRVRYGYVRDADNIMFEIEQLDKQSFKGPVWIAHIALEDRNDNRAFRSKV